MNTTATHNRKAYRNEKLSARFYFYNNLIGLKFSRCLQLLEREFDISESTILDIIAENNHIIAHLERKQFSANDLKKIYPYFSWQYNLQTPLQTATQLCLAL